MLGKDPSWVEQRGADLLLRALPQGLRQEVVSRRTVLAAAMVFKSTWWPGGAAEPSQLPGGVEAVEEMAQGEPGAL